MTTTDPCGTADDTPLPTPLRDAVCARLGIAPAPPTLEFLEAVYAAWCRRVPFDNVRKLIALREAAPPPLPGTQAADFFEHWLAHGTGGTCWSSSNALYMLVTALGFTARRIAGSMRDLGFPRQYGGDHRPTRLAGGFVGAHAAPRTALRRTLP